MQLIQTQAAVNQITRVDQRPKNYSEGTSSLMFYFRGLQTLSDDKYSEYTYSSNEI